MRGISVINSGTEAAERILEIAPRWRASTHNGRSEERPLRLLLI